MPSPYNVRIQEHCTGCTLHREGQFCHLSEGPLATLEQLKFTSVYPKGSLLFVEGDSVRELSETPISCATNWPASP